MVKASSQIEKELGLLQQRTEDMASALDPLYGGYLQALGDASKQQLMAAAYHLCTQAYPDKFLSLSWQQRNQLQKSLQVLAAQIYTQLSEQREQVKKNSRKPQRNNGLAFLQKLLEARASGAVIQTKEGSSDDLLDKLSEIARFESKAGRSRKDGANFASNDIDDKNTDDGSVQDGAVDNVDSAELLENTEPLENTESVENAASSEPLDDDGLGLADFESFSLDADSRLGGAEMADGLLDNSLLEGAADEEDLDFEVEVPAAEQRLTLSEEDDLLGALEALARRSNRDDAESEGEEKPLSPVHLMKQQVLMEKAIQDVFKIVSEEANALLQKANVMPSFPKALMAAAADTRGLGEPMNAVPNVVKVSVRVMHGAANFELGDDDTADDAYEAHDTGAPRRSRKLGPRWQNPTKGDARDRQDYSIDDRDNLSRESRHRSESDQPPGKRSERYKDNRPGQSARTQSSRNHREGPPRRLIPADAVEIEAFPEFAVINLQLSEVEFTDPRVSVWRGRLRKELSNLKQLGLRYRKTQRSLETAQAEDAWRASWTGVEES